MDPGYWLVAVASLVPLVACREERAPAAQESAPAGPVSNEPSASAVLGMRYYVDTLGSDSAPGTSKAPFRTIQRAAQAVRPGDTVLVRPGRYTGAERIVSLSRGGRPGAWVTFRSEQRGDAVLDGAGRSAEGWYFGPGVGYIRVEGFEIRDLVEHGFDFYGGGVHDLVISGNRVHHIGRNCTDTSNGRTGASLGAAARRVAFDGNVWHDIGRLAPGEQGCSPRTTYYQNHDHGIYVADAHEITIINNLFHRFAGGWAIHRYHSKGDRTVGLLIANNTFVGANPYRAGQIILATSTANLRIVNNIFYGPNSAALYLENFAFPDGLVRQNMVYRAAMLAGPKRGLMVGRNWDDTDPGFAGPNDLHLRKGSPAVDVGLPLREVSHDADGAPRPQGAGYDLGAYER
jgi:hypothetical protein